MANEIRKEQITTGDLTETTSNVLTIGSGTDATIGSGTTIQVKQATGSVDGYISSTDWNTFNGKENAITTLPISKGGTNSGTALNNDKVMVSSAGAIIESATITTTELALLNGITSVSTGTTDNDKFVTEGYVDENFPMRTEWLQNGVVDNSDSTLAFNDVTRVFTINRTGASFDYYVQGVKYTVATDDVADVNTVTLDDTEGLWAIYYDGVTLSKLLNPSHSQYEDLMMTKCLVGIVYYDATNNVGILQEERHGYQMSQWTHRYLHETIGMAYTGGLGLGNFTIGDGSLDAHAQFSIAAGECYDEDLEIDLNAINATTGNIIFYRAVADWRWTTQTGFKCMTFDGTSATRLAYDNAGTLTEVADNKFVLMHIFATNAYDGNCITIIGQDEYLTATGARDAAETEISNLVLGTLPSKEMKPIATIIYQTKDTYANDVNAKVVQTASGDDYVDWRTSPLSAGVSAGDHGSLGGLADDDHMQYALLAGRSGDTLLIDNIDESTGSAGVTIDGSLIKDTKIYPDSSITTAYTESNANGLRLYGNGEVTLFVGGSRQILVSDGSVIDYPSSSTGSSLHAIQKAEAGDSVRLRLQDVDTTKLFDIGMLGDDDLKITGTDGGLALTIDQTNSNVDIENILLVDTINEHGSSGVTIAGSKLDDSKIYPGSGAGYIANNSDALQYIVGSGKDHQFIINSNVVIDVNESGIVFDKFNTAGEILKVGPDQDGDGGIRLIKTAATDKTNIYYRSPLGTDWISGLNGSDNYDIYNIGIATRVLRSSVTTGAITFTSVNAAADTVYTFTNTDGTYEANVDIDGDLDVDVINEHTGGAGVTIEGIKLIDGNELKVTGSTFTIDVDDGGSQSSFNVISSGSQVEFQLNSAGASITEFSTDGTLAGDSDAALPTEKAVKAYVDAAIAAALA